MDAVINESELYSIDNPEISLFAEVPITVAEECNITNFVAQGSHPICWAACVATIVNYKTGRNLTAVDVANRMGHNYTHPGYSGADANETADALFAYGVVYSAITGKLSWQNVKSQIEDDCPFLVGLQSSGGKHMLTGYGYECRYGDTDAYSRWRYVYVWDPNGAQRLLQHNASTYSISGYSWSWIETLIA